MLRAIWDCDNNGLPDPAAKIELSLAIWDCDNVASSWHDQVVCLTYFSHLHQLRGRYFQRTLQFAHK
jgi:hypothetical protein